MGESKWFIHSLSLFVGLNQNQNVYIFSCRICTIFMSLICIFTIWNMHQCLHIWKINYFLLYIIWTLWILVMNIIVHLYLFFAFIFFLYLVFYFVSIPIVWVMNVILLIQIKRRLIINLNIYTRLQRNWKSFLLLLLFYVNIYFCNETVQY